MKESKCNEAVNIHIDDLIWQTFPEAFSTGGIHWKLLHVSPEMGAWTASFS
jgi:hypothetical protein